MQTHLTHITILRGDQQIRPDLDDDEIEALSKFKPSRATVSEANAVMEVERAKDIRKSAMV